MAHENYLRPGSIALVTGASSGIGRALVEQLLGQGIKVICTGRREAPLTELVNGRLADALPLPLDVCDQGDVAGLMERLPEAWRSIDILVANAGSDVGGRQRFDQGSMEDWASTIETNVTGLMRICHAVIPGMLSRGKGHIVTLGSVSGLSTYAGGTAYSASKFAVRAFTEALRKDYKHDPIRITEILPGLVRTAFATARHRGDNEKAASYYDSAAAALDADDIAETILFALRQPPHVNIAQIVVTPTGDK